VLCGSSSFHLTIVVVVGVGRRESERVRLSS
jgi:hypothetical protein